MTLQELYDWGQSQGITDWELFDDWGMKLAMSDITKNDSRKIIEIA